MGKAALAKESLVQAKLQQKELESKLKEELSSVEGAEGDVKAAKGEMQKAVLEEDAEAKAIEAQVVRMMLRGEMQSI